MACSLVLALRKSGAQLNARSSHHSLYPCWIENLAIAYPQSDDPITFRGLCLTLQGDEASVTALLPAIGILDIRDLNRYMLKSLIYHLLDPSFFSFIQSSPWTTCLIALILLLLLLQRLNLLVQISQPFLA
jgi:hypothetical protein